MQIWTLLPSGQPVGCARSCWRMPPITRAPNLSRIGRSCEPGHALSSATFLAMNALNVPLYFRSPETVAVYHAGDIARVSTSHVSAVLVAMVASTFGVLTPVSHACLAVRANDSATKPGPVHLFFVFVFCWTNFLGCPSPAASNEMLGKIVNRQKMVDKPN